MMFGCLDSNPVFEGYAMEHATSVSLWDHSQPISSPDHSFIPRAPARKKPGGYKKALIIGAPFMTRTSSEKCKVLTAEESEEICVAYGG